MDKYFENIAEKDKYIEKNDKEVYSPHKDVILLLSSWTNFLVTASSLICFT